MPRQLATIAQADAQPLVVADDVSVGQQKPVGGEEDAGTRAFAAAAVGEQQWTIEAKLQGDYNPPILGPIVPGQQHDCANSPDRAAILRALPRVAQGVPYVCEVSRDDFEFAVECLVDQVDPPRFYPLV